MIRDEETLPHPEPVHRLTRPRRSGMYYGWLLVAATMIISAAAAGVNDSVSFFTIPLYRGFGWSSATLAGAYATGVLMNGLTSPILGHLFDWWDSRKVILISIAVAGLATVGLGFISHPWHLYLLFGIVFSSAMGGASFGIFGPLAARWFLKRRTLVLALLMAGPAVGNIFSVSIAAYLLVSYSWREAFMALGAIFLFLTLPLGLKFLRNWPSEMGLKPDGDPESSKDAQRRGSAPIGQRGRFEVERWWRAFRSPPIWALVPVFVVGGITTAAISTYLSSFASEFLGVSLYRISTIHGVMTVLGAVGAVAGGWLADRFARKRVLGAVLIAQGIAFLVLNAVPTMAGLWLFAVLAGLSGTAWMVIALSLIADIYGLRALATLWGIAFLFHAIGFLIGPALVGLAVDFTGSYDLSFAVCASMLVLASIVSFAINEGKYSARYRAAVEVDAVGN